MTRAETAEPRLMRLFAALEPSPDFRTALGEVRDRLRAAGAEGRWLEPSNLHLTLAFIGMWPEDATRFLPPVERPFRIALSHPGVFPEANVLWAGVAPCEALDRLAARVRRNLAEAGIPFDPQAFNPHITLARKPRLPEGLTLADFPVPAAEMTVREVCLYRSERAESGMVYTVIGRGGAGDRD